MKRIDAEIRDILDDCEACERHEFSPVTLAFSVATKVDALQPDVVGEVARRATRREGQDPSSANDRLARRTLRYLIVVPVSQNRSVLAPTMVGAGTGDCGVSWLA